MNGWRVARIGGIDVRVDPSFLIIALLITSQLWSTFGNQSLYPRLTSAQIVALAALSVLLFFLSILGHELAHAGMSRLLGIPVLGIVLYMLGGATYMSTEGRRPADEFLTTVVGPLASAVIGVVLLIVHAVPGLPDTLARICVYLGGLNLYLAVFNLLPSFPLDGGRLLRSVVWQVTGNPSLATVVAARTGQVLSGAMIAFVVYGVVVYQSLDTIWLGSIGLSPIFLGLIGVMLFSGATQTLRDGRRHRALDTATAAQVMSPPPPAIPADLPLGEALLRYLDGHEGEAFPVTREGSVIGFVSLTTARGVPPDRPVGEATVPPGAIAVAGSTESMTSIVGRLGQNDVAAVLVMDGGRLVGIIEPADVNRFLQGGR
jgi:Zn-dependent protease